MSEHNTDIPSGRIRFALEALREFEERDGCEVDMGIYRERIDGTCYACLGGAALLRHEDIDPLESSVDVDGDFTHDNGSYIRLTEFEFSLNSARSGEVAGMFKFMGLPRENGKKYDCQIASYHKDTNAFYADMCKLADDLEEAGY